MSSKIFDYLRKISVRKLLIVIFLMGVVQFLVFSSNFLGLGIAGLGIYVCILFLWSILLLNEVEVSVIHVSVLLLTENFLPPNLAIFFDSKSVRMATEYLVCPASFLMAFAIKKVLSVVLNRLRSRQPSSRTTTLVAICAGFLTCMSLGIRLPIDVKALRHQETVREFYEQLRRSKYLLVHGKGEGLNDVFSHHGSKLYHALNGQVSVSKDPGILGGKLLIDKVPANVACNIKDRIGIDPKEYRLLRYDVDIEIDGFQYYPEMRKGHRFSCDDQDAVTVSLNIEAEEDRSYLEALGKDASNERIEKHKLLLAAKSIFHEAYEYDNQLYTRKETDFISLKELKEVSSENVIEFDINCDPIQMQAACNHQPAEMVFACSGRAEDPPLLLNAKWRKHSAPTLNYIWNYDLHTVWFLNCSSVREDNSKK